MATINVIISYGVITSYAKKAPTVDYEVQMLYLSRCPICTQKDGQTPGVSFKTQEDFPERDLER